MFEIYPLKAFKDNYIWLLIDRTQRSCIAIDPGDALPVIQFLNDNHFQLTDILLTHHHFDHTGGVNQLKNAYTNVAVYGATKENIPSITHPVTETTQFTTLTCSLEFRVLEIPGHTLGHIAFHTGNLLFCGDTLFSAGCGRLFEGSAEQMHQSLTKIAGLAEDTFIYCAHEYTLKNLEFALAVEPDNKDIIDRMHQVTQLLNIGKPSIPSLLSIEKLTNPFLRCHLSSVKAVVEKKLSKKNLTDVETFAALREWKNQF